MDSGGSTSRVVVIGLSCQVRKNGIFVKVILILIFFNGANIYNYFNSVEISLSIGLGGGGGNLLLLTNIGYL